jgi:hypothetical protein
MGFSTGIPKGIRNHKLKSGWLALTRAAFILLFSHPPATAYLTVRGQNQTLPLEKTTVSTLWTS